MVPRILSSYEAGPKPLLDAILVSKPRLWHINSNNNPANHNKRNRYREHSLEAERGSQQAAQQRPNSTGNFGGSVGNRYAHWQIITIAEFLRQVHSRVLKTLYRDPNTYEDQDCRPKAIGN